jgi:hypothetical protein
MKPWSKAVLLRVESMADGIAEPGYDEHGQWQNEKLGREQSGEGLEQAAQRFGL